jgi:CHAT domain-containing protein
MGNETITVTDLALVLDLDLVVVPACQSGSAYLGAPDELLGVGHAFVHAGASSVIASLWDTDDAAGAYVVAALYRELGAGSEACDALAAAQREASRLTAVELDELATGSRSATGEASWMPGELANRLIDLCEQRGIIGTEQRVFGHPAEWGVLTYLD